MNSLSYRARLVRPTATRSHDDELHGYSDARSTKAPPSDWRGTRAPSGDSRSTRAPPSDSRGSRAPRSVGPTGSPAAPGSTTDTCARRGSFRTGPCGNTTWARTTDRSLHHTQQRIHRSAEYYVNLHRLTWQTRVISGLQLPQDIARHSAFGPAHWFTHIGIHVCNHGSRFAISTVNYGIYWSHILHSKCKIALLIEESTSDKLDPPLRTSALALWCIWSHGSAL